MNTTQRSVPAFAKTVVLFAVVLCVALTLIHFGRHADADTVARATKQAVLTADTVNLAFDKVQGRLVTRHVHEADAVKKGTPLLTLEATDADIALDAAKARAAALEASVAEAVTGQQVAREGTDRDELAAWRQAETLEANRRSAEAGLRFAAAEWTRAKNLLKTGGVSRAQYDAAQQAETAARNALISAERALASATIGATDAQLRTLRTTGSAKGMTLTAIAVARASNANTDNTIASLKAQLAAAQADVRQLALNRERMTLVSPDAGRILEVYVQPGDMIAPGALTLLLETDRRHADFWVDEVRAGKLRTGESVTLYSPALDRNVQGVIQIATPATSFSDLRATRERGQADLTSFRVRIAVEPAEALLTGMTLEWNL